MESSLFISWTITASFLKCLCSLLQQLKRDLADEIADYTGFHSVVTNKSVSQICDRLAISALHPEPQLAPTSHAHNRTLLSNTHPNLKEKLRRNYVNSYHDLPLLRSQWADLNPTDVKILEIKLSCLAELEANFVYCFTAFTAAELQTDRTSYMSVRELDIFAVDDAFCSRVVVCYNLVWFLCCYNLVSFLYFLGIAFNCIETGLVFTLYFNIYFWCFHRSAQTLWSSSTWVQAPWKILCVLNHDWLPPKSCPLRATLNEDRIHTSWV